MDRGKDEIWIIGTEPPCPRCGHLGEMVHEIVNESGLEVRVRHMAYTDAPARDFASSLGLEPGTAKDVAKRTPVQVDWERVTDLLEVGATGTAEGTEMTCCGPAFAPWKPELDEALKPCEDAAARAGILMTPVLVVAGKLRHSGSVPPRSQVEGWIAEAFSQAGPAAMIIEVLGPGCKNCDTLYDHVFQALDMIGEGGRAVVKKMKDLDYFLKMGVYITPGLIINGRVVSTGRVLSPEQVAEKIRENL